MSAAPSPITLEEYMRTSYSPDREYVDGSIVERNVGQGKHSYTQGALLRKIHEVLESKGLLVLPEQRVRVLETRVRIPDICVVKELEEVVTEAPLLCVEVFSPDDRWPRLNVVISEYQSLGVPCVWVVDPYQRRAWIFGDQPPTEVQDGKLRAEHLDLTVLLSDILPPG